MVRLASRAGFCVWDVRSEPRFGSWGIENKAIWLKFTRIFSILLFLPPHLVAELRQSNRDETGPQNGGGRVTDRQSRWKTRQRLSKTIFSKIFSSLTHPPRRVAVVFVYIILLSLWTDAASRWEVYTGQKLFVHRAKIIIWSPPSLANILEFKIQNGWTSLRKYLSKLFAYRVYKLSPIFENVCPVFRELSRREKNVIIRSSLTTHRTFSTGPWILN